MFCKYCGKNAGENDICIDCMKKIISAEEAQNSGAKSDTLGAQPVEDALEKAAAPIQEQPQPLQNNVKSGVQQNLQADVHSTAQQNVQTGAQGTLQPILQADAGRTGYKPDAPLGFRSNTTWKKVVACIYYVIVGIYVLNLYVYNWYSALAMLVVLCLPGRIVKDLTNREGSLRVKFRDKPFILKLLWAIGIIVFDIVLTVIFLEILVYMEENSYNFIELINAVVDALYN